MKTIKTAYLFLAAFAFANIASTSAFASGFKCQGSDGYSVQMYNNIDPQVGTRVPAVLIISSDDNGTLLVRHGAEIRKHNRANTVQYVVDGNEALGADTAILQLTYKAGEPVSEEGIDGQLILVKQSVRSVVDLECERYTKH